MAKMVGAVSARTMRAIEAGLADALGLELKARS